MKKICSGLQKQVLKSLSASGWSRGFCLDDYFFLDRKSEDESVRQRLNFKFSFRASIVESEVCINVNCVALEVLLAKVLKRDAYTFSYIARLPIGFEGNRYINSPAAERFCFEVNSLSDQVLSVLENDSEIIEQMLRADFVLLDRRPFGVGFATWSLLRLACAENLGGQGRLRIRSEVFQVLDEYEIPSACGDRARELANKAQAEVLDECRRFIEATAD